jgi:homeobox protein cut-like
LLTTQAKNYNESSKLTSSNSFSNPNQLLLQSPNAQNSFPRPSSTPSPSLSNFGGSSNGLKPLKCVLPPVSQEQFDKYANINTDDLVKKVKDLLSKFSISQRLFGECILGLSQGSVSDLLARPKPWIMLTQKGREPFIRMQMFIDDPEAIKKLMNNHYKGSIEKTALSRSGSSTLQVDNSVKSGPNSSHFGAYNNHNLNSNNNHHSNYTQSNDNSNDSELKNFQNTINIIPYDISALSAIGDLNTEEITNRVKETLLNNNIGQKLFGEAVLNLSQGTVSELLSKPKPWNTLSIKGREPYLRMYMWLSDHLKLEKLNEWKEEKNLLKRNNTEVESDHQKPKRRFIFSEEQKDQLMKAFKYDPYPAVNQMEQLASKLGLQTRTVINWFHNHRMRIR